MTVSLTKGTVPCTRCGGAACPIPTSIEIDPICPSCAMTLAAAERELIIARMEHAIARFDQAWGTILLKG
jgi:hypothetical protein